MRMSQKDTQLLIKRWLNLISEGKKHNPEDMGFEYNNVEVDIVDGGDIFMYGETQLFSGNIKSLFENLDISDILSKVKSYKKDSSLDDRKKRLRILSVYKPIKELMLNPDFLQMINNIRICKFVKTGEKEWLFYDMSLRTLLLNEENIDQYAYLGSDSENEGEEAEPGFRGFGLLKRQIRAENFDLIDADLVKLFGKVGNLKSIFSDKKMFKGFRNLSDVRDILFRHNLVKKSIKNQYDFNPENQMFE